jgi:hypothetical protein
VILEVFHTESTPSYELRQRVTEILVAAGEPPALSIEDFQAALQEIARLRASLEMEQAAKLTAEGQRWVRDIRASGRLVGDEEAILSVYRQAPEAVQALAAFLPPSPLRAGSQLVTGAGPARRVERRGAGLRASEGRAGPHRRRRGSNPGGRRGRFGDGPVGPPRFLTRSSRP